MSDLPTPVKLPNWKDTASYHHLQKSIVGREGLAWECLRRNPKYQLDWHRLKNDPATVRDDDQNTPGIASHLLSGGETLGFFRPPLKPGESADSWFQFWSTRGVTPIFVPVRTYLLKKWSLKQHLYDPNLDALQLAQYLGIETGTEEVEYGIFERLPLKVLWHTDELRQFEPDIVEINAGTDNEAKVLPVIEVIARHNMVFVVNTTMTKESICDALDDILSKLKKLPVGDNQDGKGASVTTRMNGVIGALRCWDSEISDGKTMTRAARMSKIEPNLADGQQTKEFDASYRIADKLINRETYIHWLR